MHACPLGPRTSSRCSGLHLLGAEHPLERASWNKETAPNADRLRERLGWSQQDLADKLKNFGMPIDRAQLARLELGKRGISLDETMRLAFALNVAPVHLITDPGANAEPVAPGMEVSPKEPEPVAPIPGMEISPTEARAWIRGQMPLLFQDPRAYFMNVPRAEFEHYQLGGK